MKTRLKGVEKLTTTDNRNRVIPLLLFALLGGLFVGNVIVSEVDYIEIDEGCQKYFSDDDGDGLSGFIEDPECWEYPYRDGNGESPTSNSQNPQSPGESYQPYFDLTVDFVRYFIELECNNVLNNCMGTSFTTETEFYCYFSNNIMNLNFFDIMDNFYNKPGSTHIDDGNLQLFTQTCNQFPPSYADNLPVLTHQATNPIPPEPGNSGGGAPK